MICKGCKSRLADGYEVRHCFSEEGVVCAFPKAPNDGRRKDLCGINSPWYRGGGYFGPNSK